MPVRYTAKTSSSTHHFFVLATSAEDVHGYRKNEKKLDDVVEGKHIYLGEHGTETSVPSKGELE